jgi:hypothetical protein
MHRAGGYEYTFKPETALAKGELRGQLMHPLIYANPKVWVKTLF